MYNTFYKGYNTCTQKNEKKKTMFPEFTFRGEGGSDQKDQRFTFFLDIDLWTQSLNQIHVLQLQWTRCDTLYKDTSIL